MINTLSIFDILGYSQQDSNAEFIRMISACDNVYNRVFYSQIANNYFPEYYQNNYELSQQGIAIDTLNLMDFSTVDEVKQYEQLYTLLQDTDNITIFYNADTQHEQLAIIVKAIVDMYNKHH